MEIHYPKLRNMTHALSLSVCIASNGTNFYIFIPNGLKLRKKTHIKIETFVVSKISIPMCLVSYSKYPERHVVNIEDQK